MADNELERLKMYQDSFKHMTTFSSGGILLVSTVTGALFLPKLDDVRLLALSILLLGMGALFAMFGLAILSIWYISAASAGSTTRLAPLAVLLGISVLAAYAGLVLFAFFAFANLAS